MEKEAKQNKHVKAEAKQKEKKKKKGFWATACTRKNKPACMGKIMRMQVLA